MSLCDILYFVPVLSALSSLPTLPGQVLGRCQKKSGQGQQSQLALGQLTLVPASAALCADVGISRVHLNRKLKEFGREPPSVLIRKCRMKQAARLLADNKVNVSEVAYRIVFSSHSYFSSSFREFFGLSPKEFVTRLQENPDDESLRKLFE
mgnify:CR=1 FL=1